MSLLQYAACITRVTVERSHAHVRRVVIKYNNILFYTDLVAVVGYTKRIQRIHKLILCEMYSIVRDWKSCKKNNIYKNKKKRILKTSSFTPRRRRRRRRRWSETDSGRRKKLKGKKKTS